MLGRAVTVFLLLAFPRSFAGAAPPVAPGREDALAFLPAGSVELRGWIGESLATCRKGRIEAQSIPELVRPFATRPEDAMWQTEFWGKWFTSAALACRYQPDAVTRSIVDHAIEGLLATQTPDGYIGTYKHEAELAGWDVWGRKYVLLGLLAYHDLTGDGGTLAAARRQADYTIGQIGPGKADIVTLGMWNGMAASSILEPMVLLYRRTGERRYLDFAEYVVSQWATPKGPDLLRKALAEVPVYDMFPRPDARREGYMAGGESKAYEMMSCYEGLLELHRVTGNPSYRTATENVARDIRDTEITIVGSGSSWERWCNGRARQAQQVPEWMETCVTVTWIKLQAQLLRLTGDSRYADEIERSAYNALLGAQKRDGTWWSHYSPLEGTRGPAPEQCDMRMNCCVASGPRGLMLLPALAVMRGPEGPVVNFFEPGTARVPLAAGTTVKLEIESGYPSPGSIAIHVEPGAESRFRLGVRIPAWSRTAELRVGDEPIVGAGGKYLYLERTWKPGDVVRLSLDFAVRTAVEPGGSGRLAVTRGPIVFAVDKRVSTARPLVGPGRVVADAAGVVTALTVTDPLPEGIHTAIDVPFVTGDGAKRTLRLCDYASAGQTWAPDSEFRVWLPQPLDLADPFAPAIPATR